MCGKDFEDAPGACLGAVTSVALTSKINANNTIFMFCRPCARDFWNLVKPAAGPHMGSMSCCYCKENCIGKNASCFELIESFTPVSIEEFRSTGGRFVFCEKCTKPIHSVTVNMSVSRGGTLPK